MSSASTLVSPAEATAQAVREVSHWINGAHVAGGLRPLWRMCSSLPPAVCRPVCRSQWTQK